MHTEARVHVQAHAHEKNTPFQIDLDFTVGIQTTVRKHEP